MIRTWAYSHLGSGAGQLFALSSPLHPMHSSKSHREYNAFPSSVQSLKGAATQRNCHPAFGPCVSLFLLSPMLCPANVLLVCHRHNCLSSTLSELCYCFCFHLHLHPTIASMLEPRATVGLSELVPFLLKLYFFIAFPLMFEESCFTNFIKFFWFYVCVWLANNRASDHTMVVSKSQLSWLFESFAFLTVSKL